MHNEITATCKNCEQELLGKHCHNCGQTAHIHPINIHFIWHDIQHGLLHFDKGILFTAKELFLRPGITIRDFMTGKRVKLFNPISFVIFLATLQLVLNHIFHLNQEINVEKYHGKTKTVIEIIRFILEDHYTYATFQFFLPLYFSIGTYLAFKKQGYNFTEHFVLNCFLWGLQIICQIVITPINHIHFIPFIKYTIDFINVFIFQFGLILWFYFQFFNKLTKLKCFLLLSLSFIINLIILFVTIVLSALIFTDTTLKDIFS